MFLRGQSAEHPVLTAADSLIRAWTNAFRLLVAPFVVSHLYLAIAATRLPAGQLRRLGLLAPAVFLGLLIAVLGLSYLLTAWLMALPVLGGVSLEAGGGTPGPDGPGSPGSSWVDRFIPPNLFGSPAADSLVTVMILTIAFALAARRLAPASQRSLERMFRPVGEVMFVMVEWLLMFAPLVLLALGLSLGSRSGLRIGGVLLVFSILTCVVLLVAIVMLYPVATLLGRIPLLRFTRAVWPAQLAAAATRSSLATVPMLMAGAEEELKLSPACSGYVIPLAGALLKLSRGVSEPVTLLFLAGLLGLPLSLRQLVVFTGGMILLSASSPGVPRVTAGVRSMPLYVAVGIPPEYVLLLAASSALTDVLMTVLNSTGYMTAAVLVERFAGEPFRPVVPSPAAAPLAES